MTMQMQRAFSSRMLSQMTKVEVLPGSYDDKNNWVLGGTKKSTMFGVIKAGNKFSQFEEGIALHSEDGGSRYSDFRTLYCTDRFPVAKEDKIIFKGVYYNIIQKSDEDVYGFNSYIIERAEGGEP